MSTAIAIGASTLQLPDPGESYSLPTLNQNFQNVANEQNSALKIRHFEASRTGQNDEPANTLWGPGMILGLVDNTSSKNYSDWTAAGTSTDSIKLTKEGVYSAVFAIRPTSANLTFWHIIAIDGTNTSTANNSALGRSQSVSVFQGDWYYAYAKDFYVGTSGLEICFKFSAATASVSIDHRIRITKHQ